MRLDGWSRLLVVATFVWLSGVVTFAYLEYPSGGRFGGIPVGPFTYWTVIDAATTSASATRQAFIVSPKISAFALYGLAPVIGLWLLAAAARWVKAGFRGSEG